MAATTFVSHTTVVTADYMNQVDALLWDIFQYSTTVAEARAALGITDADLVAGVLSTYYTAAQTDTVITNALANYRDYDWLQFAIGDQTNAITTGTAKFTTRFPACTVLAVRASLKTASTSGTPTFDINEGGTSILGNKLVIDQDELTSTTAATAATITDATIADDAEITFDIDTAGTGAIGPVISVKVRWT